MSTTTQPFRLPTGDPLSGVIYEYRLAPKSLTSFTKLNVKSGTAQDIDIKELKDSGLHLTLWLFKKKIDPQQFQSIRGLIDNLPNTKGPTFDSALAKDYPSDKLRAMLLEFMSAWYKSTLPERGVTPLGDVGEIRKELFPPGWSNLHTVTTPSSVTNTQVSTSVRGTEVGPAVCRESYLQVLSRISQLDDFLQKCATTADVAKQVTCLADAKNNTQQIMG